MAKKDSLIVASKVKAYVRSKKMMTSSDALGAISDRVYCMLDKAIERTKANRRSTVKPQDL
jgi:hypothetical protein